MKRELNVKMGRMKKIPRNLIKIKPILIPLLIFIISLLVYHLVPQFSFWYRHYVYLAKAFLNGRFDLQGFPNFYHDLIKIEGKIYIPFAPAPAFLLMPLVFIWGTEINQALFCQFFGALNVTLTWILLKRLKMPPTVTLFLTILFGFGTVHFYSAVIGTTWYLAHVIAVFFLLLALVETFGKKRFFFIGFLLGLAALSRETAILSTPFFLWALFLLQGLCGFRFLLCAVPL